jgi:GTP-binding protein LepA
MENIRNFCIIAHIDHGKSTLADRFLEITQTVEKRKMKDQYLDQLELERERGITIKMAPVRMIYTLTKTDRTRTVADNKTQTVTDNNGGLIYEDVTSKIRGAVFNVRKQLGLGHKEEAVYQNALEQFAFILNLIDTPGHPDFGYEVSRALAAVEGAILLVDATQGIQAQTLSNFYAARKAGLKIIGAVNKIDAFEKTSDDRLNRVIEEVARLIDCPKEEIHKISGKTGQGVKELLEDVILRIPPPSKKITNNTETMQTATSSKTLAVADRIADSMDIKEKVSRALIFDSFYDDHKGIVATVRVFEGSFKPMDEIYLASLGEKLRIKEVGYFTPQPSKESAIFQGEIGYIVTGLKEPNKIKIGDTIISANFKLLMNANSLQTSLASLALPGYQEPRPVVFVSFFPHNPDDYDNLKKSLERLKLNDWSFVFYPDNNEVLGRGFVGGFLGKLHFEIILQRLEREFGVQTVVSFPSVAYKVKLSSKNAVKSLKPTLKVDQDNWVVISNPADFPENFDEIWEPMVDVEIICPTQFLGPVLGLKEIFRWEKVETEMMGEKIIIRTQMPLSELISDFDDKLKSVSCGYASFSYQNAGYKKSDLVKMDILLAGEEVSGLSRILPKKNVEAEARRMVLLLKETLPKQQFPQAVQARVSGRIIARETIPALKKLLGNFGKTGGDRTRKMKLWKKQKEGKKKLLSMAKVKISAQDFKKLLSKQ